MTPTVFGFDQILRINTSNSCQSLVTLFWLLIFFFLLAKRHTGTSVELSATHLIIL